MSSTERFSSSIRTGISQEPLLVITSTPNNSPAIAPTAARIESPLEMEEKPIAPSTINGGQIIIDLVITIPLSNI